jgi:outer membrane protein
VSRARAGRRRPTILWVVAAIGVLAWEPRPAEGQASDAQPAGAPLLTLEEAIAAARTNHPALRRARADVGATDARSDAARAPLLPQLRASAGYQLSASESRPISTLEGRLLESGANVDHNLSFGVSVSQLLWDFGGTRDNRRAALELARAQAESAEASLLDVLLNARLAYFTAGAARALVDVAAETLANQERHLAQVEAYVEVDLRPAIDLAQARAEVADARVALIQAANDYDLARVRLNQAMGLERSLDYDVDLAIDLAAGQATREIERSALEALLTEALEARPELAALAHRLRAQALNVDVAESRRWPTLSLASGFTESGGAFDDLYWSWFIGLTLDWRFYQGGLVGAQVRQAEAELAGLHADHDLLVQAIRVELEQTRLAVHNGLAVLEASGEVVANARERLRLAEGRYETEVGSALELNDAQLALTRARVQEVRARFELAIARAQLLAALGRD